MALILVVDDSAFMRRRCRQIVEAQGHSVVEAADGREALTVYAAQQPDAVLLDVTMPEMDGMAALQALRAADPLVRVAMVSALDQQTVILEAVNHGARDYITKPFEADRLQAAIEQLLA